MIAIVIAASVVASLFGLALRLTIARTRHYWTTTSMCDIVVKLVIVVAAIVAACVVIILSIVSVPLAVVGGAVCFISLTWLLYLQSLLFRANVEQFIRELGSVANGPG